MSQVPEQRDCRQRYPICREEPPYFFLRILNNQPMSLPLRPTPAHRLSRVRPIECLLWDKHVTPGAPGVGFIPLLQVYYTVPRVSVRKLHQDLYQLGRFPSASLHRAPKLGKDVWKGHPILRWCPVPVSGGVALLRPNTCYLCQWAASNPAARLTLPSGQCTLFRILSQYDIPCPITCRV